MRNHNTFLGKKKIIFPNYPCYPFLYGKLQPSSTILYMVHINVIKTNRFVICGYFQPYRTARFQLYMPESNDQEY